MSAALIVFLVSLAVCIYVYFGYPALLYIMSRLRPRSVRRGPDLPSVTLVVAVFNEEKVLRDKLENTAALDYPREKLEAIFVSDGSTDGTDEMIRSSRAGDVRLIRQERQGKAFALNAGVSQARGEIVVFSDANNLLEPDAVRKLVANFSDEEVGGVCGNKKLRAGAGGDTSEEGENLYWRYDKWQKQMESRIGSIFAADGTLYAIRRKLFVPMEDPAQADDIAISTRVVLQGFRLVWEEEAIAWETAPGDGRQEFRRKIRVTNHSVRALLNLGSALWTRGFYSLELLSHKLLRHLVPFFMVSLLLSNLVLAFADTPAFGLLLLGQLMLYILAGIGTMTRNRSIGRLRLFYVPYYFCMVNAAALLGVLSIAGGARIRAWTPRGT